MHPTEPTYYFNHANNLAARFEDVRRRRPRLLVRYRRLRRKYGHVASSSLHFKLVALVAIPAHLAFATMAGLAISQVFAELYRYILPEGTPEGVAYVLPTIGFLAFSLIVALSYTRLSLERHPVVPRSYRSSPGRLALAGLLTIGYVAVLYLLAAHGKELNAPVQFIQLIILMGLLELGVGFLALKGYEILLFHLRAGLLRRSIQRTGNRLRRLSNQCAEYYHYHVEAARLVAGEEHQPRVVRMSPHIQRAINFSESKEKADDA